MQHPARLTIGCAHAARIDGSERCGHLSNTPDDVVLPVRQESSSDEGRGGGGAREAGAEEVDECSDIADEVRTVICVVLLSIVSGVLFALPERGAVDAMRRAIAEIQHARTWCHSIEWNEYVPLS